MVRAKPLKRLPSGWKRRDDGNLLCRGSGARFHRQLAAIRQIENGSAVQGEAALYQRANDLMVTMTAWMPRGSTPQKEATGTLIVRTGK
jgi:hypothetical protein